MSRYPTILDGLVPTLTVFANTDDDIEAVVAGVETLAVSLRAIANEGKSIIFEVILELCKRPVAAFIYDLFCASKIQGLDTTSGL